MKHFSNQSNGSHVGRMNYGGAKFCRFALFPLMLLMLLLLPGRMVAQTDYDESVTFTALAGNPEGYKGETYANLVDGRDSKWCCEFSGSAYVIFKASKAGVPVGYTITTGNDNETWGGRNPLSWKLYGNNTGSDDAWELIDKVENDKVLQDKNNTSYDFTCEGSTSYQYFKWEISAIHRGRTLQVGEFELKLNTCSHKNADGSDALGEVTETVEPTCTEHGYTAHKCSLCNSIVKVYKDDVLKPHKLTHHALKAATCTEAGNIEYRQCSVCNKLFSDEATTKEITDAASLVIPAKGHTFDREGNCTVCQYKDSRYALFNLEGITDVTITDNDSYPWKMLDLNADGMSNVSSYFTAESKGLMSNNYGKGHSTSEIIVKFNVEKPILFSFKYLISAKNSNHVFITLNGKRLDEIKGTEQKVYKSILNKLNKGEYTLTLSYNIFDFGEGNKGADRAFIYDLNTATTISDYVAELDATNTTLTFKKITSDNLESIDLSRLVIVNDKPMVKDMYDVETKNIKNIVFDESFKTYAPTSLEHFFAGCSTLETISGLEYLNTEKVTNMSLMFYGCSALTSLDLTNFNTANVTDMNYMFYRCSTLTSLDLKNFNTAKVVYMDNMFGGCSALESLNLTNFNTANVTDMNHMFYDCSALESLVITNFNTENVTNMSFIFGGCSALESLNLTNFNTANVTDMSFMFHGCSALKSLDLTNFNTAKVVYMDNMFYGCSALKSLDLTNFNTAKVTYMNNMFYGCSALTTIYASDKFDTDNVRNSLNMFTGCKSLKDYSDSKTDHTYANYGTIGYFTPVFDYAEFNNATGTLTFRRGLSKPAGAYDLNEGNTKPGWLTQKENIYKVVFDASFANTRPTSCCKWFDGCQKLTEIKGIENLNTQNVTDMSSMFSDCQKLTSLNVTNFNTANVEDMRSMFKNCSALTGIFASNKFVTDMVIDGSDMFSGCDKLIGAIKYIGSQTDHHYANYENGYFSPEGGFPAYAVFDGGTRTLTFGRGLSKPAGAYDLNVENNTPGWNAQKENIEKVVFDASFANARPTSCYYWFCGCSKLTDIEGIENLNTENVTDMGKMFDRCSALTSLDLTNFNTAKVSDMSYMFMGCIALTTIFVSDKFVTDQVTDGRDMFHMCINLIGAIEYDGSKSDHTYANYDNGYFSPEGGFHAYAEFNNATGTLTFSRGLSKPAGAYDLNEGNNTPEWRKEDDEFLVPGVKINIKKVVFDASFANARPTSCYKWFDRCYNLTEIEGIENLNTEKVTNMGSMFLGCYVLNPLDVSNFNTQNVEDMSDMFVSCMKLKSLNVSNFDTQKVKDMSSMFYNCNSLTSLDVSNFNTQKVDNMRGMFSNCKSLITLDLSEFDTQNVTNMSRMFWKSSALTTIYVSDKFVTTKVSSGSEMFKDCTLLKGAITEYSDSKTDHTYANYTTGYFSKLVGKNGEEKIGATGETTQLTVDNLALADNKDFVAYEPFTATAASYNRTMKEGTTWATLCLPFEVSLADQNFRAFKLLSANEGTNTVELEEIETSIEAGTPVIIKMKDGATKLDFSVANKNIAKDIQTLKTADGNYQLLGLYTQKEFSKDADNNCYIVKGNKLMNPAKLLENTKVTRVASKPFRAYMVDKSSATAGAKMFSIGISDSTTAIDSLNTIANDKAEYYDLQGNRLNEPQKGINIVKRGNKTMKVIIK